MPSAPSYPINESSSLSGLDPEDFRRLGVRLFECRQSVIRLAAHRSARALANQQLTSPSETGLLQLSRVATSAYRLLDPRRRSDPIQRVLVGRILSDSISEAAPTYFVDESEQRFTRSPVPVPMSSEISDRPAFAANQQLDPDWTITLGEEDLVAPQPIVRRIGRTPARFAYGWVTGLAVALAVIGLGIGLLAGWPLANLPTRSAPQTTASANVPAIHNPSAGESPDRLKQPPAELAGVDNDNRSAAPQPGRVSSNDSVAAGNPASPQPSSPPAEVELRDASPIPAISRLADMSQLRQSDSIAAMPDQPARAPQRKFIEQPQRPVVHPVPSHGDEAAARRELADKVPLLTTAIDIDAIDQRIAAVESFGQDQSVGSAAHWAAQLVRIEHHWLIDELSSVMVELDQLVRQYEAETTLLSARSFSAACELAIMPKTQQHLLRTGLRLLDWLLIQEAIVQCRNVSQALTDLSERSGHVELRPRLREYAESAEKMERFNAATNRWLQQSDKNELTTDAGIAGRYLCLMVRRWPAGLPWLASVSDRRLAKLAQSELAATDGDARHQVALQWIELANRSDGREAHSMRLHAIELLKTALDEIGELKRLEALRTIDQVSQLIPEDLRPSDET